jgi:hypothetical protein
VALGDRAGGPGGWQGLGRHFFQQTADTVAIFGSVTKGTGGTATDGLRVDGQGSACAAPAECASGVCTGGVCKNFVGWASGEPNEYGSGEDYAHFWSNGTWNDYPLSATSIAGLVVEYGGMAGDTVSVLSASRGVRVLPLTCFDDAKGES